VRLGDVFAFVERHAQKMRGGAVAFVGVFVFLVGGFGLFTGIAEVRSLVWAFAMMISFSGWGATLSLLASRDTSIEVGLRTAWGMAVVVWIGGLLVAAGLATGPVLRVIVGIGIGVACANAVLIPPPSRAKSEVWGKAFLLFIAIFLTILLCVSSLTDRGTWWSNDDTTAYLVFPKQLVEAGDMIQPFSFRRMSSYGGQSLLQAVLLVGAAPEHAHLFDKGICSAVLVAMLLGRRGEAPAAPFALRLLVAMFVLFLPNYRLNLAAVLSGTVFLFAISETLELPDSALGDPRVRAVILGLLVGAASALRPFFMLPAGLCVLLAFALRADLRGRRSVLARELFRLGAVSAVAILPWAIALLRSNGTPLFPGIAGYYLTDSGFTHLNLDFARLMTFWDALRYWEPIGTIHLFFLAALIRTRFDTPAFRASTIALLVGGLVMLALLPQSAYRDRCRYICPLELAFVLTVALRSLAAFTPRFDASSLTAGIFVVIGIIGEIYWRHEDTAKTYDDAFKEAHLITAGPLPEESEALLKTEADAQHVREVYSDIQGSIPAGAPVLAMLEEPYRLDFGRNRVAILDLPGLVGPRGGVPLYQGPDKVAEYFLGLGIRYLALVNPRQTRDLYSIGGWEEHAKTTGMPQNALAPRVLDVFDNFEKLRGSKQKLYEQGNVVVLDLASQP
jgi:hypothetical protein